MCITQARWYNPRMSSEVKTSSSGKQGRDLTTGSIPRHLVAFAIPMFISSLLQTAYSFVNAWWVSNGLGKTALAAVTVSMPIIFVLIAVAFGVTMAANILAAQAYGAKDWQYLKRVVSNSVILAAVMSLICVLAGHIFAGRLIVLAKTAKDTIPMTVRYMQIIIWTVPPTFAMFLFASLLRGTGDSTTPLRFQAAALISNAILDPLLMFGWLGLPKLGLNGTAFASIISYTGAVIGLAIYLRAKKHIARPDWRHLRTDWATSSLLLKVGLPTMFQQSSISIGLFIIMSLVNTFGKDSIAAFGASIRIDNFAFMPALTVGMAVSALAGQNIGAKKYDRVQEVFKWGIIIGCGTTFIGALMLVTIPSFLLTLFTRDPVVIAIGVHYLRIVGSSYVILAAMFVSNGVINGAGHTMVTTIVSMVSLWFIRVPLAAYLSHRMHRVEGIWWAMAMGFFIGTILSLAYYFSGRWKKPLKGSHLAEEPITPIPDIVVE